MMSIIGFMFSFGIYFTCGIARQEVTLRPAAPVVLENSSVTLTCSYSGTDATKHYSWFKGFVPVGILTASCEEVTSIISVNKTQYSYSCPNSYSSTWTIKRVESKNQGDSYRCNIETTQGNEDSNQAVISLLVPVRSATMTQPQIETIEVEENVTISFQCVTSGSFPASTVEWLKDMKTKNDKSDDVQILTDITSTTSKQQDNTTVTTSNLKYKLQRTDTDQRLYCRAYTPSNVDTSYTFSTRMLLLRVFYGPENLCDNVSSVLVFTEGENKTISCFAVCYPSCSYIWSTGSMTVTSGELFLGIVRRDQAGTYSLTAKNAASEYKKEITKNFQIIVRYAPVVHALFSGENHTEGSSMTLFCKGSGVPATYTYTYLTQTVGLTEIPNNNTAVEGTAMYSSIYFKSLQLQDTGNYTCQMNNGVPSLSGILDQSDSIELLVSVKPMILSNKTKFYGVEGGSVTARVSFYCYPAVQSVTLYRHDGLLLTNDVKYITFTSKKVVYSEFYGMRVGLKGYEVAITITVLNKEDFASYTIHIQNIQGVTTVGVFVVEERRPSIPRRFDYHIESTGLMLVWEKDFNGGHTQTFVVQVSVAGLEDRKNTIVVAEDDILFKINETFYRAELINLKPGAYRASLVARNSVGESEPLQLNFTIEAETGKTEDTSRLIGGFSAAIAILIIIVVVLVVERFRKGYVLKGCRKTQTPESLKYSDLKQSESKAETCTYEGLQSGLKEDSDKTYDSLH